MTYKKNNKKTYYKKKAFNRKQENAVKSIVRKENRKEWEKKRHDVSATINMSSTGQVIPLTIIPQGTGDSDRIGEEIVLSGLRLNAVYQKNFGVNAQPVQSFRIVLFYSDGVYLPGSIQSPGTQVPTEPLHQLFIRDKGVHVIWDKIITVAGNRDQNASLPVYYTTSSSVGAIQKLWKLTGRTAWPTSASDPNTRGLYMYVVGDEANSIDAPQMRYSFSVSYYDP